MSESSIHLCTSQYCKKVWLGLWNSAQPAEPESRDEQKIKDFMVQKYERKRWYIPPQQVSNSNSSQAAPEPKPLKQLLGENTPAISVQVSKNESFLVNLFSSFMIYVYNINNVGTNQMLTSEIRN